MKYLPTFNINAPGVYEAVRNGQFKVQRGQWVWTSDRRGPNEKPSRFVSAAHGYLNIVHPDGPFSTGTVSNDRFIRRLLPAPPGWAMVA